jgi:CRISPR-associated protein (TIGR02710 family)
MGEFVQSSGGVRCLLVSVGGTPNPVAYAIDFHRPEKVIFFASRDSRAEIETRVRPLTAHRWTDQQVITTSDPQDLTCCMEALVGDLPRVLTDLKLTMSDLLVDYTGGTKTMSAAMVLATIHQPVLYSYVGGTVRAKEGLGVVLDGSEAVVMAPNPWDVLAVELRRRIGRQFNRTHFAEAAATAGDAARRVGERWRSFYLGVKDLCEAYGKWSSFDYPGAASQINSAYPRLRQYAAAAQLPEFLVFLGEVERDLGRLAVLVPAFRALQSGREAEPAGVRALIVDLVAQADRTCRLATRPDDGVARLYSALEKLAKSALAAHGVDNSAAAPEQIPEALRAEFIARYLDPGTERLRFGLDASYRLLAALGEPLGARYQARAEELRSVLDVRNNSLLVHGWRPVAESVFEKLVDIALDFLDVAREELPALPRFPET